MLFRRNNKFYVSLTLFCLIFVVALFYSYGPIDAFEKNSDDSSKIEVRADGTLMIHQKPFFPFGLFHVSWDSTLDQQLKDLQEISDAGFNLIHASAPNWDHYDKFLDKADQLGIYVISEQNSGSILDFVKRFKNKPAVLGWKIADDVDIYKDGKIDNPTDILSLHQQIKKLDPNHITYIAGAIDKRIADYVNVADSIGATAYPVGHEEKQPISWAYHMVSIVHASALKNHLVTAALQTFRWPRTDASIPSISEIRNLTYQSILAGAKGVIYYTYYDEIWNLSQHPVLWKGLKSIIPEINAIKSILLNGKKSNIFTDVETVKSSIWFAKNKALVIVVNMSYSTSDDIVINIPENLRNGSQLFKDKSLSFIVDKSKIRGSLGPLGVSIFEFIY